MFAPGQNQLLANLSLLLFLRIFRSFVFMILKRTFEECVSLFSYQRSVLHCRLSQTALLLYHVVSCLSRTFSTFFDVVFVSLLQQLWYLITSSRLLSRTFFILFFKFFFICISNSDIISCLQFPVNTFFIFFSTLFNQISVVCQKKSASLRSGFIISLFSFCVKYYFTFFYIFFTLSPISL